MRRALSRLVAGTACVGLLSLAGCGTSERIADGNRSSVSVETPSTPTTPTSSSPVSPSPSSTPTTVTPPADPRQIKGAVYSFTLPPGWKDETNTSTGRQDGVDVLVTHQLPSGRKVLLEVFSSGQQVLPSQLGSPAFRKDLLSSVAGPSKANVVDVPDLKIDGELAVGVRTTQMTSSGHEVMVTLYMPTRFYLLYPVVLYNLPEDHRAAVRGFRSIVDSWAWVK